MQIKIDQLQAMWLKLMQIFEDLEISEITIDNDYYWNIESVEKYNPYTEPKKLDMGQLSDDWNDLVHLLSDDDDDYPILTDFNDFAEILRAIADKGYDILSDKRKD